MTAKEVIDALRKVSKSSRRSEKAYQELLEKKLNDMKIRFRSKQKTSHPSGTSRPDLIVTGCMPPLHIEVKKDGDWRCVGEAVAELFSAAPGFPEHQKVAAFDGCIKGDGEEGTRSLKCMMEQLNVWYIEAK